MRAERGGHDGSGGPIPPFRRIRPSQIRGGTGRFATFRPVLTGWLGSALEQPGPSDTRTPISVLKHLRSRTTDQTLLQKGFTLVELLVVIVILGILAAVVVFAVGGTQTDAKKSACRAEMATVETAYEAFKAESDGNVPPTSLEQLRAGGYLKRLPSYVTTFNDEGVASGCAS